MDYIAWDKMYSDKEADQEGFGEVGDITHIQEEKEYLFVNLMLNFPSYSRNILLLFQTSNKQHINQENYD